MFKGLATDELMMTNIKFGTCPGYSEDKASINFNYDEISKSVSDHLIVKEKKYSQKLIATVKKDIFVGYAFTTCEWGDMHAFDTHEEEKLHMMPGDVYERDIFYSIPSFAPPGNFSLNFMLYGHIEESFDHKSDSIVEIEK